MQLVPESFFQRNALLSNIIYRTVKFGLKILIFEGARTDSVDAHMHSERQKTKVSAVKTKSPSAMAALNAAEIALAPWTDVKTIFKETCYSQSVPSLVSLTPGELNPKTYDLFEYFDMG